MSTSRIRHYVRSILLVLSLGVASGAACQVVADASQSTNRESPKLGRRATASDIAAFELSVESDGTGLPDGSGSVAQGKTTYSEKCAGCHGEAGSGGPADRLTGGVGSVSSKKPLRTAASYWPYAPSLFDYIRRAMPFNAPQSLSDSEVYGLVAYLLSVDGIVPGNTRLKARSLSRIVMPNRDGFVSLKNKNFDGNIKTNR